jgi:transcriptional regulator with XRE-family HTH domain
MTPQDIQAQEREVAQSIGRRLRQLREQEGLTLRDLAQRLGFPHHTILLKYERGETVPSAARLVSLARALNSSPAALLARDDQAIPIITAVDRADAVELAQLAFILETLATAPSDHDASADTRSTEHTMPF